jgi:DNA gyrase subunit A
MPIHTFREQRRGGLGVAGMQFKKEDDTIKNLYIASTHDYLLIFTNYGRCYWLKVWQIPESGRKTKGKPIINLMEDLKPDERVAALLKVPDFEEKAGVLIATRKGVIKKTDLSEFSNPRKKGVWALNLDEGDEVVAARLVNPGQQIMLFTYNGMAVRFDESDARSMGRVTRGVRGVKLKNEADYIVGCEIVNGDETVLIVCEKGFGKRSSVADFRHTSRGVMGVRSIITSERNGNVVGALVVTDQDGVLMMSASGQAVRIRMSDVRVLGRTTQGVKLANLKESDYLIAIQKVEGSLNGESENGKTEIPATEEAAETEEASAETEEASEDTEN